MKHNDSFQQWLIGCWQSLHSVVKPTENQHLAPAPDNNKNPAASAAADKTGGIHWQEKRVPFLIYRAVTPAPFSNTEDWRKLFEQFFERKVTFVPLSEVHFFLLVPYSFLTSAGLDKEEETISVWAESLLELMQNEGMETDTVVTHYGCSAPQEAAPVLTDMKTLYDTGKLFYPQQRLFSPWILRLERTLHDVARPEKERLLLQIQSDYSLPQQVDPEAIQTLDVFLSHNLNASETSRALFIHRNTLLYRLDKWKEETGLDPRRFDDAFMIKLYLLLTRSLSQ